MDLKKQKWNKYSTKSLKYPKGRRGSEYYSHLLKAKGEKKANELYEKFYYQTTGNGFSSKTINKI